MVKAKLIVERVREFQIVGNPGCLKMAAMLWSEVRRKLGAIL